jgi:tRNA (adenine57-N1/adenine58-N1)-methyltransferase
VLRFFKPPASAIAELILPLAQYAVMKKQLEPGEYVLLYSPDKKTYLINLSATGSFGTHLGEIRHSDIIGKEYGETVKSNLGRPFVILEPTLEDRMMKVKRLTQIIYPKDAALIILKTGLQSGMQVVECGAGSGASTIAIANAIAPTGRVTVYDRDEKFLKNAKSNVERVGLGNLVEYKVREVAGGFDEEDVDVVLLDLPSPWEGVEAATRALRGGGRLASISPTYNQVERMGAALEDAGFVMVETVEVLLRNLLVRTGKTRPVERMVSHTGFLTFSRKALIRRFEEPAEVAEPVGDEPFI